MPKNTTTKTAAASIYQNFTDAQLKRKLQEHDFSYLPDGLKHETLVDLCDTTIRDEWESSVSASGKEHKRASRELTRIAEKVYQDLELAMEKMYRLYDVFSTDMFLPSLEKVPAERLPELITAFRSGMTA